MQQPSWFSRPPRRRASAGFTVIEVVIALFVLVVVLVAVLALFDASNRVARAQIHIADMQQSLRVGHDEVVRMTRMAARGWVLRGATGWTQVAQVTVPFNNAPDGSFVDSSTTAALKIFPGTDVLRIRGVIAGSLFEITNPGGVFLEPKLELKTLSPSGLEQDLEEFKSAEEAGNDFGLLLVSAQGEVGTADGEVSDLDPPAPGTPTTATVTFDPATSTQGWLSLPGHPVTMAGIIEEYAFYVRDNNGSPRLSLARFKPGTNLPYGGDPANLRQDIADDVIDLQVALGIDKYTDTNLDTFIDEKDKGDGVIKDEDGEWFYATPGGPAPPVLATAGDLHFVRINTLARTQGRDFQYVSSAYDKIEDHNYGEPATPASPAETVERSYHRRHLQTVVALRNR